MNLLRGLYLCVPATVLGLALACVCAAPEAGARNLNDLNRPMELEAGSSPRMHVTFNHSSHRQVACRTCHHMGLPDNRYAPCTNEACHSQPGASNRKPMSVYMAYHAPDTDRSCYGCHKKLAGKYPNFKGCQPCHMTPQGRKAAARADAGAAK